MKSPAQRLAELQRPRPFHKVQTICTHCGTEKVRRVDVRRALSGYTCGTCRKSGYLRLAW